MKIKFLQAGNGDCFLLSFKYNDRPANILIDGGISETYFSNSTNISGELKQEIDNIRSRKEAIDLLVLTHIDNDHICGLLKWFELDNRAYELVKNVWFNSGKLVAKYFNEPENEDLRVGLKIFSNSQTGVGEALDFEDYLNKKGVWNQKVILEGQKLEEYGVKIQILSPNEFQLKKLLKEYKEKTGDPAYTSGKEKDWNINIKDFTEEENEPEFLFSQDNSVKNGSSISFILTFNDKNFLFLADSHPKGVVTQLKALGYNKDKPLEVEVMKVSHHGSKANTNKELLEIVKTENYIISTDSSGHNHPNKRTLARILKVNPDAIFHFNYEHVRNEVFSAQDRQDFQIKARITKEIDF
ncbi:MBL fold metallo-hydrolase [Flectobacillus sp. DC10W]|uniref:MBL fold metallo-hydrolase n=1 Tax=Flectobacillus longus TaxID=2984207 RepID=A0ABT6YHR7_9BACT|nr:MBL fold metallo-hydrolase [Flectobacillus longus]MDI9863117.1 MBL fold metallo-hydrolase [Flectobacillus longus]